MMKNLFRRIILAVSILSLCHIGLGQIIKEDEDTTELMLAAQACDYAKVKELIDDGADIYAEDENGNTVLHYLADGAHSFREYLRTVRYIDRKAANDGRLDELYNKENDDGDYPIYYTLLSQIGEKLGGRYVEKTSFTEDGITYKFVDFDSKPSKLKDNPFIHAIREGDEREVAELISRGHKVSGRRKAISADGREGLKSGKYKLRKDRDRNWVYHISRNVNMPYWDKRAFPLREAVHYGHKDIIQLLIDNGANINEAYYWGGSALETAIYKRDYDMVDWLIEEQEADVNILGEQNAPPINIAIRLGDKKIVQRLIDAEANLYPSSLWDGRGTEPSFPYSLANHCASWDPENEERKEIISIIENEMGLGL